MVIGEASEVRFPAEVGPVPLDFLVKLLLGRPAWHADALCQEHPEVDFFPERGVHPTPAKQICARCLVKAECRAWALDQPQDLTGVWGGTTALQRRQMRRTVAA